MWSFDLLKNLKTREYRLAWLIAIAADAIQIGALPFFAEGAVSPADTILDLAVAAILVRLLGWHWALLPSFAAELIPGLDLFPTWTAAVFFMTRRPVPSPAPEEVLVPEEAKAALPPGPES
jgi:hypothetical protein